MVRLAFGALLTLALAAPGKAPIGACSRELLVGCPPTGPGPVGVCSRELLVAVGTARQWAAAPCSRELLVVRSRELLATGAHAPRPPQADPSPIAVVVNTEVPADSLDDATVRRIFLRRQRFWGDGALVAPVNLPATSPVRDAFSRAVLGRSPRDMADFWNDQYFHGVQPPPVLDSQRAVLLYVARTPGAIGYVASDSLPPAERRDGYRVALVVAL